MAALNLEQDDLRPAKKKNTKILKVLLGISVLVAVPVIGTTLAASITVNSSGKVQFGQGVIATAACDTDISVALATAFSSGSFVLDKITLSNLNTTPTTADVGCGGKYLKIRVYKTDGSLVNIDSAAATQTVIQFLIPTSGSTQPVTTTGNSGAGTTITGWTSTAGATTDTLVLQLNGTKPAASLVDKVTIESVDSLS